MPRKQTAPPLTVRRKSEPDAERAVSALVRLLMRPAPLPAGRVRGPTDNRDDTPIPDERTQGFAAEPETSEKPPQSR
jgi:hypothetical protein